MKTHTILLHSILPALLTLSANMFGTHAIAQTWGVPGATWYYTYYITGYDQVVYAGDTMMGGGQAQKFESVRHDVYLQTGIPFEIHNAPIFTRHTDDLVELWVDNAFDTLWYFSAAPGDHWYLPISGTFADSPRVSVLDTGTMAIDGVELRWLHVEIPDFFGKEQPLLDTIIERIGSITLFMDPVSSIIFDEYTRPLRCYSDDDITFTTMAAPNCTWTWPVSIEEVKAASFALFPNPAKDQLTLTGYGNQMQIELRDGLGRVVYRNKNFQSTTHMDISMVPPGIYSYNVTNQDFTSIHSGRIVISQ